MTVDLKDDGLVSNSRVRFKGQVIIPIVIPSCSRGQSFVGLVMFADLGTFSKMYKRRKCFIERCLVNFASRYENMAS